MKVYPGGERTASFGKRTSKRITLLSSESPKGVGSILGFSSNIGYLKRTNTQKRIFVKNL